MTSWTALRNSFIGGLVLIMPLVITLFILRILVNFLLQFINPVVQGTNLSQYTANVEIVAQAIAVVLIMLVIVLLGYLAQRPIGQRVFGNFGRVMSVVPLVRTIYATVRQITSSVSGSETSYESLVLVEFPRKGVYAIGLSITESPREVQDAIGEKAQNVFLPSSPNPTGGRMIFVPEDNIHQVDLSVREGLGLIMTTGASTTEDVDTLSPELARSIELPESEQPDDDGEDAIEDDDSENDESGDEE
jgi:uncharacterized membrane protein